jgi:hypothetical protein
MDIGLQAYPRVTVELISNRNLHPREGEGCFNMGLLGVGLPYPYSPFYDKLVADGHQTLTNIL